MGGDVAQREPLLRVRMLGTVRITRGDLPLETHVPRNAQALLAYLVLRRRVRHSRVALAGLFWGEGSEERARNCLRTALWRLRRVLEPDGIPSGTFLLAGSKTEVGFNTDAPYWLDVEEFEAITGQVMARPAQDIEADQARRLEDALGLYTGDLLEGFYEDWVLRERERLYSLYQSSVARLMAYYKGRGAYEQSLACGQRLLAHDPLREDVHREMMRLYLASGQRALALQQYERCRALLAAELGVPPLQETQALYAQALATTGQATFPAGADTAHPGPEAVQQLNAIAHNLGDLQRQLHQAIEALGRPFVRRKS